MVQPTDVPVEGQSADRQGQPGPIDSSIRRDPPPALTRHLNGAEGSGGRKESKKEMECSCTSIPSLGLTGEDGEAVGDEEEEVVEDGDEGDIARPAPTSAGWFRFSSTCLLLAPGEEMDEEEQKKKKNKKKINKVHN